MKEHHLHAHIQSFSAEMVLGGEWSLYDFAAFIIKTVGFHFDYGDESKYDYRSPVT